MVKIICIGELLIDFICRDIDSDLIRGENFIKKAGGAPANAAAVISKLGGHALFAGKVGDDSFGHFLKKSLEDMNIDTSMLILDKNSKTTLAFVSLKNNGERDFIFNRGADELYDYQEFDLNKLKDTDIVHFGSATALLGGSLKAAYYKILDEAKNENIFISFDPNYRSDLWKGRRDEFIKTSKDFISKSDFVKVSDGELSIISGIEDKDRAIDEFHKLGAKIVAVTLGKDGSIISTRNQREIVKSIEINSIDSTGAGDAFIGAVLLKIAEEKNKLNLEDGFQQLKDAVYFGNKVGAYVCTKIGAMTALDDGIKFL
jgi:fructokinase